MTAKIIKAIVGFSTIALLLSGCSSSLLSSDSSTSSSSERSSSESPSSSSSPSNTSTYLLRYVAGEGGTIEGVTDQIVSYNASGSLVTAIPEEDYVFDKWSDGLLGPSRVDANITEDATYIAYFRYVAIPALPIVRINTINNEAIDSQIDYTDATVGIENTKEAYCLTDVPAGIRLRGHSTATMPKKPYRVKFDNMQSLFGHTAAKSWVLLADYLDPSKLHNFAAFSIGQYFTETTYQPSAQHVIVTLNGTYQGMYLLTEQVDEKPGRADLLQSINAGTTDYNFLIEMDLWAPEDPSEIYNETYFSLNLGGDPKYISIKYPEIDDFPSRTQYMSFVGNLRTYMQNVANAFQSGSYNQMQEWVDVASLTDMALVDQIMRNPDHDFASFYFSKRAGEKLVFGPTWDYDLTLGYDNYTGQPNLDYDLSYANYPALTNYFYSQFAATPAGQTKLSERYNAVGSSALEKVLERYDLYVAAHLDEIYADADFWYGSDYQMVDDNIKYLKDWLVLRKTFLDGYY